MTNRARNGTAPGVAGCEGKIRAGWDVRKLSVSTTSSSLARIDLWHILKCWLDYYHRWRPHQGLGNVPVDTPLPPPAPIEDFRLEDVVCHEALGGLLKHYELRAA